MVNSCSRSRKLSTQSRDLLFRLDVPAPQSLDGQRNEGNALSSAGFKGGPHFPIPSQPESIARVCRLLIYDRGLQGRDDGHVQSCITASLPILKEDVGWSSRGTGDETTMLPSRSQIRLLGGSKDDVTKLIVSRDPNE